MRHSILLLGLLLLLPARAACAMGFAYQPLAGASGLGLLFASGKIKLGDDERLHTALRALPAGTTVIGLSLDSPGGDLEEGVRLANTVRGAQMTTVVANRAMCASACFLVFAAGSRKFASTEALLGVHSASYAGLETPDAQIATLTLARRLSDYDVPDAILGKLVTARPSQVWWLTRAELEGMRVDMNPPQVTTVPPPAGATAAPAAAAKHGAQADAPPSGYQVAPPASGFRVWNPGSHG